MIRDTSNQDVLLAKATAHRPARRWLIRGGIALALFVLLVLGARRWMAGERSVDRERVRIAEVVRGTLVRDIAADAE